MSGIWKSLVDDPKAALDAALPTLMQDLTQVGLLFEHNPAVTRRVSGHKQMAWHVTDACLNAWLLGNVGVLCLKQTCSCTSLPKHSSKAT